MSEIFMQNKSILEKVKGKTGFIFCVGMLLLLFSDETWDGCCCCFDVVVGVVWRIILVHLRISMWGFERKKRER